MLPSPDSGPGADPVTLLHCQRAAVSSALHMLDQLAGLVPTPECVPGWNGEAKTIFVTFLGDVSTELFRARVSLQGAVSDVDAAIAEAAMAASAAESNV